LRIAVAGGTGFLGSHIAGALAEAGHSLRILSRSAPEGRAPGEWARCDVTDAGSLGGSLDGCDAVVQAVQFPNHPVEVPRRGLTYDRFDRQGTSNMVAEAERAGVERFFYLSGAGADPGSDKSWYRAKGRAEQALRASGLTWSILRPSWAYGPGDRALNRLATIARFSPVVPRLGVGPQRVQPVFAGDIGLAVRRIFERDEAWGVAFEIGGEVMTMDEILHTLLKVMGKRRLIVPVPVALAKLGTAPLVLLPAPPMTPQGVEFAVQDGLVDTAALREVLGVDPVPLHEGLSRYLGPHGPVT
jgi:NADH dehydrogenase